LQRHRCLLPANGFYEWKTIAGAAKQPMHIGMKDAEPFAMAGLTERWLSSDGEVLDTCTIITTSANSLLAGVHDRMPVIIAPESYERWLDVSEDEVIDLLRPYPSDAMKCYPVSTRVNAVRNDDATIIARVEEAIPIEPELPLEEAHVPEQAKLF
jgi:putative SOS response-associated peptidase YedK